MEEQKPKSIKIIGLLIAIISGFIILINVMDVAEMLGFLTKNVNVTFSYYLQLSLTIIIGITYLVGGIFIIKYKLWANRVVSGLSTLVVLIFWGFMINKLLPVELKNGMQIFVFILILIAIFFSIPLVLLIWFLNKKKIKKHFT